MMVLVLLSSCCSLARWRYGHVPDKLEAVAIIGFGTHSKCVVPNKESSLLINDGGSSPVWIRVVFSDKLKKPVVNRSVKLLVVNAFGEVVDGLEVTPTEITTKDDGFQDKPILLTGNTSGVYRLRADYSDKLATTSSYSPPIIVLKSQ